MFEECFGDGPFVFRLNDNGTGPQLLTQVCLERGWREFSPDSGEQWNLWWRTSGFPLNHYKNLNAWQYINHIPKGSSICRKDNLVRYLRCMRKVHGSIYDFSPNGFNLPLEYTKLAAECSADDKNRHLFEDKPIWICKPVAQSQGKGIFLFRKLSELHYDSNTIVQRYIEKPLLIGGYKFDLRLYVCVPSYHPVTIYMYREGLVRFATDKFTLNDLRNPFRHLTNSSINKFAPGYAEMKDRIGSGCKWTLRQLRRYFQQAGICDWLLWQRISSLVVLTVLSHVNQIPPSVNCFEFFGFDVLIDSSLRPWLLEVNLSPALGNDCDADRLVKKPMLHDMFDLMGLPLYNTGLAIFDICLESDDNNNDVEKTQHDEDASKNNLNSALYVMNAAGRCRRKHMEMSVVLPSSRANSAARSKIRRVSSSSSPKHFASLPKLHTALPKPTKPNINSTTSTNCNFDDDLRRCYPNRWRKWGNGRDWSTGPVREGNWIRIWPMNDELPSKQSNSSRTNIKPMVSKVIKYTKTAKDLARNHPTASECQLNEFLLQEMEMSADVWMPPI